MATKTFEKCDKCGDEWLSGDKEKQLWGVAVYYAHGGKFKVQPGYRPDKAKDADWCRKCMIEQGILHAGLHDKELKIEPKPQPPTIVDLIREIVREEVAQ